MPIHVAITRKVRAGKEAEFEEHLRAFFHSSFPQSGVLGAHMIRPLPGSDNREYGILRSFAGEAERDAFYHSPSFKAWDEQAATLTEGKPQQRDLQGLEAWFRTPGHPPRWKMAVATVLGVYPTSVFLGLTIGPLIGLWPIALSSLVMAVCMVALLTWVVMPVVTRVLRPWL